MIALRPHPRLFVALDLPDAAREGLAACARALAADLGGRAVPPDSLHVTLHFLGVVPPDRGPDLAAALRSACAAAPGPIRLRPGPLAALPARRRARLIARELHGDGGLAGLHEELGDALARALGRPARGGPLWPHVTLVRFRRPVAVPGPADPAGSGERYERPFDVSRASLYDSVQIPGHPPRYDVLVRAPLGTATP